MTIGIFRPAGRATSLAWLAMTIQYQWYQSMLALGNNVQQDNPKPCVKTRSFQCFVRIALTYGIWLFVFTMGIVFNPRLRGLHSSCSTITWLVSLVIGSAPASYAGSPYNTTPSNATYVPPVALEAYETVKLVITLLEGLYVAAYNDSTSADPSRKPGIGIWGVGIPVSCRPKDNLILMSTSEFDKAASAVASTVMILIPTLLRFAPLPTANIRALHSFDIGAALSTAAMTLGLYSKGLSTLGKAAVMEVKVLCGESAISLYGEPPVTNDNLLSGEDSDSGKRSVTPPGLPPGPLAPGILALHGLYDTSPKLGELREKVLGHKRPRKILVTAWSIGFTIVQLSLLGVLARALPMIDDIQFIWICVGPTVFFWWLGGAAMISGILRTLVVSSFVAKHEIFHLNRTPGMRLQRIFPRMLGDIIALSRLLKPDRGSARKASWAFKCIKLVTQRAMSRHPMVVVLRLISEDPFRVRHPICFVFLGLVQAMQFVFLTFLFGSIWGGTLFYTLGFVTAFMCTIFVSRAISIWLCVWLERALGMTVIECKNATEMTAAKRILTAMPDVLVESKTDAYKYSAGYRLDKKCQNHSRSTGEEATEHPSPRALGLIIGLILGVIGGAPIGAVAFIASAPAAQPSIWGVDPLLLGGRPALAIGVSLGLCFAILLFAGTMSEFGALSGHVIGAAENKDMGLANIQA